MERDIVINNLCKHFDNFDLLNLNGVIKAGETNYIMAPSGNGKTTLLRILMGLETYDSGSIKGLENKRIAAVFQEDRLVENLTSINNIALCSNLSIKEIVVVLEKFGLKGFENAKVNTLSGGMKRRVSMLRAILSDWEVLILDEPFKGLDDVTKEKVIDETKKWCKGKTVVFVTHNENEIERFEATNKIEIMIKTDKA